MRSFKTGLFLLMAWGWIGGCASSGSPVSESTRSITAEAKPTNASAPLKASTPAALTAATARDNPTTKAGRGEPSLDDAKRPAAWVYMAGREGKFGAKDGRPHWVIDGVIDPTPTFRIEVFEPLLGTPRDVNVILDSVELDAGGKVGYAFAAKPGTFQPGREYSLLRPGESFVIRNRQSGDVVSELLPLEPGSYVLMAAVKNLQTGKEALAITSFRVGLGPGGS